MYNHKPKSNARLRKITKQLTVGEGGGGVNPYGQPDRKISRFFFDDFPKDTEQDLWHAFVTMAILVDCFIVECSKSA